MQKYYITDGSRYIKKGKRGKYNICTSPVMADMFPIREAEKILENSLCKSWQKIFYLEGVEDFSIVKQEDLKEDSSILEREDKKLILDYNALDAVEDYVKQLLSLSIPSKKKLLSLKKDLEDMQQYYDRALSDIRHWIRYHEPQAHIRTKVYGIQHKYEVERQRIKQDYSFVIATINSIEQGHTYSQLINAVKQRIHKEYTPNTEVYEQLNELVK